MKYRNKNKTIKNTKITKNIKIQNIMKSRKKKMQLIKYRNKNETIKNTKIKKLKDNEKQKTDTIINKI